MSKIAKLLDEFFEEMYELEEAEYANEAQRLQAHTDLIIEYERKIENSNEE